MADSDVPRWFSEGEVAVLSDLPGPLVEELLRDLPSPETYTCSAELYDGQSVHKAWLAALVLHSGIRMKLIRVTLAQPVTREDIADCCRCWATSLAARQAAGPRARHRKRSSGLILAAMSAVVLLTGVAVLATAVML